MQQYFVNYPLNINDSIILDEDVLYHIKKVLRNKNGYLFRICDSNENIFLVKLIDNNALVIEKLDEYNELDIDITVVMSLIKPDYWDIAIQKLTELGVNRIVPLISNRSDIRFVNDKKLIRYKKIVKEASEQSHRNKIPEICDYIKLSDIDKYKSLYNIVAYEKENDLKSLSFNKSVTIVIGPEGGFEKEEIEELISKGFISVSLGKRILRAETASIYATCMVVNNS